MSRLSKNLLIGIIVGVLCVVGILCLVTAICANVNDLSFAEQLRTWFSSTKELIPDTSSETEEVIEQAVNTMMIK